MRDVRTVAIPGSAGHVRTWSKPLPDGGTAAYYAVSLDGRSYSGTYRAGHRVQLRYVDFDPALDRPTVPVELTALADNRVYIVQFVCQPLVAFQDALRAMDAVVLAFLPQNAMIVEMDATTRDRVAELPHVRWVGPYHPAYKLDEAILSDLRANITTPQTYSVMVFGRGLAQQQPIVGHLNATGGTVINTAYDGFRMTIFMTPQQARDVGRMNQVQFIDPWGPAELDMDIARQIGGASTILAPAGFSGQGVRGEVFDTGIYEEHPEWAGKEPLWHKEPSPGNTHGTACYGICFATGANPQATGMLPDHEQGVLFYFANCTQFGGPYSRLDMNREATDPHGLYRCMFQTSSAGSPATFHYSTISAEVDDYLFQVDYLSCQAAGNDPIQPLLRPQAWAKNIVGCGGLAHHDTLAREDDGAAGGVGPASDGRVKPDLIHFHDSIFTTFSANGYAVFSGTSASTPIVAGHFGLMFQLWHEGVFPGHGGGASVFDDRCKSSTARALLINSAYR